MQDACISITLFVLLACLTYHLTIRATPPVTPPSPMIGMIPLMSTQGARGEQVQQFKGDSLLFHIFPAVLKLRYADSLPDPFKQGGVVFRCQALVMRILYTN